MFLRAPAGVRDWSAISRGRLSFFSSSWSFFISYRLSFTFSSDFSNCWNWLKIFVGLGFGLVYYYCFRVFKSFCFWRFIDIAFSAARFMFGLFYSWSCGFRIALSSVLSPISVSFYSRSEILSSWSNSSSSLSKLIVFLWFWCIAILVSYDGFSSRLTSCFKYLMLFTILIMSRLFSSLRSPS